MLSGRGQRRVDHSVFNDIDDEDDENISLKIDDIGTFRHTD